MEFELKECPFCGQEQANIHASRGKRGVFIYVKCGFCGAQSKTYATQIDLNEPNIFESQDSLNAVGAWNMRGGVRDA